MRVDVHLPKIRPIASPSPAKGVKERFNHRHSSLRMTVKRTFAVLKGRWKILTDRMPQMRLEQQCETIVACCTLHNFILLHQTGTLITPTNPHVSDPPNVQLYNNVNQLAMDELRDKIAEMILSWQR